MTQYENSGEFTINSIYWEIAVDEAHRKYDRAVSSDAALFADGIDNQRLYLINSGGNEVVDAPHARFTLFPQNSSSLIEGVALVVARVPMMRASELPVAYRQGLADKGRSFSDEESATLPSGDIFIEMVKSSGETTRALLTPDGPRAYHDSDDIVPILPNSLIPQEDKVPSFFDIAASLDTAALQQDLDENWPDPVAITQIFKYYDVHPQETTGPNSSSSAA